MFSNQRNFINFYYLSKHHAIIGIALGEKSREARNQNERPFQKHPTGETLLERSWKEVKEENSP